MNRKILPKCDSLNQCYKYLHTEYLAVGGGPLQNEDQLGIGDIIENWAVASAEQNLRTPPENLFHKW